jgi:uncharacterized coiled-coil protein SlyX
MAKNNNLVPTPSGDIQLLESRFLDYVVQEDKFKIETENRISTLEKKVSKLEKKVSTLEKTLSKVEEQVYNLGEYFIQLGDQVQPLEGNIEVLNKNFFIIHNNFNFLKDLLFKELGFDDSKAVPVFGEKFENPHVSPEAKKFDWSNVDPSDLDIELEDLYTPEEIQAHNDEIEKIQKNK